MVTVKSNTGVSIIESLPFISVVVPMKNEVHYIEGCINSILEQNYPSDKFEIIVVDGGSTDGSVELVKKLADANPKIKLLGGPGVNCPTGMNVGIKVAKGDLIAKVDGHGYVAHDFLKNNAAAFGFDSEIKCVGGPIRPVAESLVANANVYARSSRFGVGGGVCCQETKPDFVDSVQCGTYEKEVLDEIGYFDESLQFGEDEEINWRIKKAGYKIFSTPAVKFYYYPRNTFKALYNQYKNYGFARVKVIRKHPDFFRVKHLIPAVFVLSIFGSLILGIISKFFLGVFAGIAGFYVTGSLASSFLISVKNGWRYLAALPLSFASLHFGYGVGFLKGLFTWVRSKLKSKGITG